MSASTSCLRGTLSGGQVTGCPRKTSFSSFARRLRRRERRKKELGDTPNPGREPPAPLKLTPKGVSPDLLSLTAPEGSARKNLHLRGRLASLPGLRGCPRKSRFPLFARRLRRRAGDENVGTQPQAPG